MQFPRGKNVPRRPTASGQLDLTRARQLPAEKGCVQPAVSLLTACPTAASDTFALLLGLVVSLSCRYSLWRFSRFGRGLRHLVWWIWILERIGLVRGISSGNENVYLDYCFRMLDEYDHEIWCSSITLFSKIVLTLTESIQIDKVPSILQFDTRMPPKKNPSPPELVKQSMFALIIHDSQTLIHSTSLSLQSPAPFCRVFRPDGSSFT